MCSDQPCVKTSRTLLLAFVLDSIFCSYYCICSSYSFVQSVFHPHCNSSRQAQCSLPCSQESLPYTGYRMRQAGGECYSTCKLIQKLLCVSLNSHGGT